MKNLYSKKVYTTFLAFSFYLLFISGCGINGPSFTPVNEVPDGKSIVYIYKSPSAWGKDVYLIRANGIEITKLKKGGYYPYLADMGVLKLQAKTLPRIGNLIGAALGEKASIDINIEPGREYYVTITVMAPIRLTTVIKDEALKQIKKCKKLPANK